MNLANSRLRIAVKNKDLLGVARQLELGGDPLDFVSHEMSALSMAIESGQPEIIGLMLAQANPQKLAETHAFALFLAAASGQEASLRLLARKISPRTRTGSGLTPLMAAAANGQLGCVRLLCGPGQISGMPSYCGDKGNALHAAARHGEAQCVAFLLEHCSQDEKDANGFTPLEAAVNAAEPGAVRAFVHHAILAPQETPDPRREARVAQAYDLAEKNVLAIASEAGASHEPRAFECMRALSEHVPDERLAITGRRFAELSRRLAGEKDLSETIDAVSLLVERNAILAQTSGAAAFSARRQALGENRAESEPAPAQAPAVRRTPPSRV
jgi:hypothetical protein